MLPAEIAFVVLVSETGNSIFRRDDSVLVVLGVGTVASVMEASEVDTSMPLMKSKLDKVSEAAEMDDDVVEESAKREGRPVFLEDTATELDATNVSVGALEPGEMMVSLPEVVPEAVIVAIKVEILSPLSGAIEMEVLVPELDCVNVVLPFTISRKMVPVEPTSLSVSLVELLVADSIVIEVNILSLLLDATTAVASVAVPTVEFTGIVAIVLAFESKEMVIPSCWMFSLVGILIKC